ncbi:hypothetical protein QCQ60_005227 [Bacillus cereus]|nr:hypothetical protein [Bacillus cereus]
MGVDYYVCKSCEDTFCDCGYFVSCICGYRWCCDECAENDGVAGEIDEETGDVLDDSNTCKFCRNEDFTDWELFKFARALLGKSREELVELYKEKGKTEPETVTISKEDYEELLKDQEFLNCLDACGVDNWQGYEHACEMLEEEE